MPLVILLLWFFPNTENVNIKPMFSDLYESEKLGEPVIYFQADKLPDEYIMPRIEIAIDMERATGVPVAIQIAVDIVESSINKVSTQFNNDCWITCKCNYNTKLRAEHKHKDLCFRSFDHGAGKYYYFRKFLNLQENWETKARIISGYKWFKPFMSFEWYAERLQGCYAEDKRYAGKLIYIKNTYLADFKYEVLYL